MDIQGIINQLVLNTKADIQGIKDPNYEGWKRARALIPQLSMGMTAAPTTGITKASGILKQLPSGFDDAVAMTSKSRYNPALGRALEIIRGDVKAGAKDFVKAGDMVMEYGEKLFNKPINEILKRKTLQDIATALSIKLKL